MQVSAIQKWINKRPFSPFEIVMSSGDRYPVRHPENLVLSKEGAYVFFKRSPQEALPDVAILSYLHIAAAEPVNGKRKQKK